jgi:hypothetical protein
MAFDDIIGNVLPKQSNYVGAPQPIEFEDIKDRVGRFSISNEFVVKCPDVILKIMRDMIIIEALLDPSRGNIKYLAYSIRFDVVPNIQHGDDAPEYEIRYLADGTIEYNRI